MDQVFTQLQTTLAGRFTLERELGRGGMGVVYLARDVALDRSVAIKLLPAELAAQSDAKERFLREARTAAQLSHPNIVPIHLVEEHDGAVFFVMAYVDGETLGERVRRAGPLPPPEVVRVVRDVAWALGYAHGRGVIHRDIKPDNILLEHGSGRAMVADFGIARVASRATMSQEGEILGTLQYMAPEQADPAATLDGRSDLYALGATAFYSLTGRLPFAATTAVALIAMHVTEPAPPVTSVRADVPAKLAEAVDRCLAKDPASRFATAEALAESLGAMAVAKSVPPSIIAVRDASITALLPVCLAGIGWGFAQMMFPLQAAALGWFAVALAAIGGGQFLSAVRIALRDGLSHRDIVEGIIALTPISARTVEVARRQAGTIERAFQRPFGRAVAGVAGGIYLWLGATGLRNVIAGHVVLGAGRLMAALGDLFFLALGAALLGVALGRVRRFTLLPPEQVEARRTRGIRAVWDNPPMRVFVRIAGIGLGRPKAQAAALPAATEVLLGNAADSLFEALPKNQRGRLREVPAVIKAVERTATSLRARRDQLEQALAEAGMAQGTRGEALARDIAAARDAAAERLKTAMTALENLRLDLLRLRADVGGTGDLTGSLEEARRVGESVDAELEGRREAERLAPS